MRIAEHIELLTMSRERGGALCPVLMWDDTHVVLVDCGLPKQLGQLREAVEAAGFALTQITELIFTHQDLDHIGCAKELLEAAPGIRILAYEEEAPYIQFDVTPAKLAARERNIDSLPPEQQEGLRQMLEFYKSLNIKIDQRLSDGEVLPYCGGIEIIHTPGHTPGHIVLFVRSSGVLICGDALNINEGKLTGANPVHTLDMELAASSIGKLKRLDIKNIATYHGGVYEGNAVEAIKELID